MFALSLRGASRDVQRIVIGFLDQTNKTEKKIRHSYAFKFIINIIILFLSLENFNTQF